MDDVERGRVFDRFDGGVKHPRVGHDVASVLLAHQRELHLKAAEHAVAHEGPRWTHVAGAPGGPQDVRHLPHVVDDALLRQGGIPRAQRLERHRPSNRRRLVGLGRHERPARARVERAPLLDAHEQHDQPGEDDEPDDLTEEVRRSRVNRHSAEAAAETAAAEAAPSSSMAAATVGAAAAAVVAAAAAVVAAAATRPRSRRRRGERHGKKRRAERGDCHHPGRRSAHRTSRAVRERVLNTEKEVFRPIAVSAHPRG